MDIQCIEIVIGVILFSMTLHEAMHGFMAYWLGDDTAKREGRLTLNPIKHIDPFLTILLPLILAVIGAPIFGGAKPVPFNPANIRNVWGVALVAGAGPLVNLVLAFICYGVWVAVGLPSTGALGVILNTAVWVNLGFFAFNILPIPPLDGSRVLYALAPDFVRRGMDMIERYGLILVLMIVLLFNNLLFQYMGGIIGGILAVFARAFGVS